MLSQRLPGSRSVTKVELALRKDGRFLAMRATNISNVGARCVSLSPLSKGSGLITGSYDIPAASLRSMAVYTNTTPTQAYRSSGRPEVVSRSSASSTPRPRNSASIAWRCAARTW